MKMDEDGAKIDSSAAHSGNKVLPVSDQRTSSMNYKKYKIKGEMKTKALSRMKELLKWAASSKSHKSSNFIKALHFRNRTPSRAKDDRGREDDEEGSNESPKISLRWDLESSSALSSISELSFSSKNDSIPPNISTPRKGSWITTDSEFVVLELRRD